MTERWLSSEEIVETLDRVFGSDEPFPITVDGHPDDSPANSCTLSCAIDNYRMLALDPDDGPKVDSSFERWIALWGDRRMDSISSVDVHAYLSELWHKDFSEEAVDGERGLLSSVFSWARRCGLTHVDPTRNLPPLGGRPKQVEVIWSFVEQRKLLNACKPEIGQKASLLPPEDTPELYLHPLVLLALQTGLRLGNLLHLEWRHVDLFANTLRIPPTEVRAGQALEIKLPRESAETLLTLWEGIQYLEHKPDGVFDAWGLPHLRGVPDEGEVIEQFRRACRRARIRRGDFASLRATFAYNCCHTGVPFSKAAKLVDWDDVGVLVELYQKEGVRRTRRRLRAFSEEVGTRRLPRTPVEVRRRRWETDRRQDVVEDREGPAGVRREPSCPIVRATDGESLPIFTFESAAGRISRRRETQSFGGTPGTPGRGARSSRG